MDADQIQYAAQASENVFLVDESKSDLCKGEILSDNFDDVKKEFYISVNEVDFCILQQKYPHILLDGTQIYVEFEVKHSYFDTLHKSVINVPVSMVEKITFTNAIYSGFSQSFGLTPHCPNSLDHDLSLDEYSQFDALSMIIHAPTHYPVIVSGPFGTGKTKIIARSTYEFAMNGLQTNTETKILLCAHHSKTIDAYLSKYLLPVFDKVNGVKIVKVVWRMGSYETKSRNVISRSIYDFRCDVVLGRHIGDQVLVIITTYTMSLHVADALSNKSVHFTHILLDEAAQVREPEAVAALSLGNANTKVVIAGDSKQVHILLMRKIMTYFRLDHLF